MEQDYAQALKWFSQSAERGYANAEEGMGLLYRKGRGVTQNVETALSWYQKAAAQGNEEAQNAIAQHEAGEW